MAAGCAVQGVRDVEEFGAGTVGGRFRLQGDVALRGGARDADARADGPGLLALRRRTEPRWAGDVSPPPPLPGPVGAPVGRGRIVPSGDAGNVQGVMERPVRRPRVVTGSPVWTAGNAMSLPERKAHAAHASRPPQHRASR